MAALRDQAPSTSRAVPKHVRNRCLPFLAPSAAPVGGGAATTAAAGFYALGCLEGGREDGAGGRGRARRIRLIIWGRKVAASRRWGWDETREMSPSLVWRRRWRRRQWRGGSSIGNMSFEAGPLATLCAPTRGVWGQQCPSDALPHRLPPPPPLPLPLPLLPLQASTRTPTMPAPIGPPRIKAGWSPPTADDIRNGSACSSAPCAPASTEVWPARHSKLTWRCRPDSAEIGD